MLRLLLAWLCLCCTLLHVTCTPQPLVYVYDLPPEFNRDVLAYNQEHLEENAEKFKMGKLEGSCLHNMFTLEILLPQLLVESGWVTTDPSKATFFYVPAYTVCHLNNDLPQDFDRQERFHARL